MDHSRLCSQASLCHPLAMRARRGVVWLPILGLVLTMVMWSGNAIVSKIIMREASPVLVSMLRFTLAGLFFFLPVFLALHRGSQRFTRQEWPRVILLGAFGTAGSQALFMLGLNLIPATEAGIYQVTTPVFVVLIAWLWLHEGLSRLRAAGIVVAFLGATLLLTGGGGIALGTGHPLGALLMIMSDICWAWYTVMSKPVMTHRSPLLVLSAACLVAMITLWPASALLGVLPELPSVVNWSWQAWAVMAYLVFVQGTCSQWLYAWTIRELGPSRVSAAMYLKPLFIALMAIPFLGEEPTWLTVVSGVLILGGVWLVNRRGQPAPTAAQRVDVTASPILGQSSTSGQASQRGRSALHT
jgi:drug/metabolite transporter (DMT)-like permease